MALPAKLQQHVPFQQRQARVYVENDRDWATAVDANDNGHQRATPAHYRISDEPGYFPAGSDGAEALLVKIEDAELHQIHPRSHDGPLAIGTLTLRDPDDGTADDVALVGKCGDTVFYVMNDDATTKTSDSKFYLMLPKECIAVDLTGCSPSDVLRVESLLAARTKFHDVTTKEGVNDGGSIAESSDSFTSIYPDNLPDDFVSRSMFWTSSKASQLLVAAGEKGASQIDAYGEKKKEMVTESRDVKVGKTGIKIAKGTRTIAEKTYTVTEKVSGKISDYLGGRVGRAVAIKEGDSASKKRVRSFLLASSISYAEIGQGASEGYERMVQSAQSQATSYVAKKYGKSAAELCRHTTGAAANFGRAALTAQRVVNVKKLVKSAGKQMVKEGIKGSL